MDSVYNSGRLGMSVERLTEAQKVRTTFQLLRKAEVETVQGEARASRVRQCQSCKAFELCQMWR